MERKGCLVKAALQVDHPVDECGVFLIKVIKLFVTVSGTYRTVPQLVKISGHVGDKSCTAD